MILKIPVSIIIVLNIKSILNILLVVVISHLLKIIPTAMILFLFIDLEFKLLFNIFQLLS